MAPRHRTPDAARPDDGPPTSPGDDVLGRERWELLRQINGLLDGPAAGGRVSDAASELDELRQEMAALRSQVAVLTEVLARSTPGADRPAEHAASAWTPDVHTVEAPTHPGRGHPASAPIVTRAPAGPLGRAGNGE